MENDLFSQNINAFNNPESSIWQIRFVIYLTQATNSPRGRTQTSLSTLLKRPTHREVAHKLGIPNSLLKITSYNGAKEELNIYAKILPIISRSTKRNDRT